MTHKRNRLTLVALLIISMVACTTSQVVGNLEVALDAVSVALPILGGLTGTPTDLTSAAVTYVAATNQALGEATTILGGPGTDAEKAVAITAAFASIAVPVVPPQYAALSQMITTVASDVAAFLASVPALATPQARAVAVRAPHTTKWAVRDRLRLMHAHSVAVDNAVRLAKLLRKQ